MKRIFISDLHLEDHQAPAFLRFKECLEKESRTVDEIYILGDLVEMWIGDDDDSVMAEKLRCVMTSSATNCKLFILHGNRDFLFGQQFCHAASAQLLSDPHLTSDGLLLSHGDVLCTDDEAYQAMRKLLRSETWQADILSKSLAERKLFGQGLREQSKNSNANKSTNIMDVNAGAVEILLQEHNSRVLIHGHTHRPGVHVEDNYTRIVTGAWEKCGWLCRQVGDELKLECFSLARRYGT